MPESTASTSFRFSEPFQRTLRRAAQQQGISMTQLVVTAVDRYLNDGRLGSSFDLDDPAYARHRFYTGGSDKRGHSERMSVRVPPIVAGEILRLVQSGKIPEYRTTSDMVRDAVYHRLHDLEAMINDPKFTNRTSIVRLLAERQMEDLREEAAREYATRLTTRVEDLIRAADWTGLATLIEEETEALGPLPAVEARPGLAVIERARKTLDGWLGGR